MNTNQIGMFGQYLFVKNFMEGEKCIYYIQNLSFMNRLNSLKHVQLSDTHNSNQKKEKERKKEENSQFATFRNICNIMKSFEN